MQSKWNHRFCPIFAPVLAVFLVGCHQPPGHLADAQVTVDAGSDAGTAQPLRAMESRGLFGQTPIQNRFFDPTFSQIDGIAWSPFSPSYSICPVTRLHQRTPQGLPALRLDRSAGQASGQVTGMAKGAPGPMEVSVWLGRLVGTDVSELRISLYGLFLGGDSAVALVPDPGRELVVMDGVTWVYYRAFLADGPVSWAYLFVVNQSAEPLFLTAPVFVRVSAQARRLLSMIPAVHRPLLPVERATWRDWQRRLQNRFGGAPRPFIP
jgi:hypothetical protein